MVKIGENYLPQASKAHLHVYQKNKWSKVNLYNCSPGLSEGLQDDQHVDLHVQRAKTQPSHSLGGHKFRG